MICMWEAICVGLEPQPLPYSVTQALPYSMFPKIHPHLHMRHMQGWIHMPIHSIEQYAKMLSY